VRCIGDSVLVVAFSSLAAQDLALLVFPNSQIALVSADDFEFRAGVAVILPRPRLREEARTTILPDYRPLFDFGPL
jgi:hypothetical protein